MDELKKILSVKKGKSTNPEEDLLRYLDQTLDENKRFDLEEQLLEDGFENDAVEGLQQLNNTTIAKNYTNELNARLDQLTHINKRKRKLKDMPNQQWALIAVVLILLLCLMGYYVLHLLSK
jgi:hypothetical protein